MIHHPDELLHRRFRKDTEILLDPNEAALLDEDEHNTEMVLENDSDPSRAEQLMQIARDYSQRAVSPKARAWYLRVAAISGAVYTLWMVKKHWERKHRE